MTFIKMAVKRRRRGNAGGGGDTTPPAITNVSAASLTISMDVSEPATIYMLRNTSATLLAGAAIKAGQDTASGSPWVSVEGPNTFSIDDSGWADGTYYLHFAGEDAALNITPLGPAVEWIKTTPFTAYSHVLNPAAASSGLRYDFTANTIFNIATSKSAGYWLGGYAYFDGTNWTGDILSVGDSANATGWISFAFDAGYWRQAGGSIVNTTPFAIPGSVGWYFVTMWILLKEAADATPRTVIDYWRNGTKATGYSSSSNQEAGLTALNRFGFGHLPDSTPSDYNNYETCGLCWGTGNPELMHAWVYNSGTLRDVRDYNFAGDANGCTLNGFWPAGKNSGPAFDVADVALDDSINALDTPILVGTMQWAALTAPIGA